MHICLSELGLSGTESLLAFGTANIGTGPYTEGNGVNTSLLCCRIFSFFASVISSDGAKFSSGKKSRVEWVDSGWAETVLSCLNCGCSGIRWQQPTSNLYLRQWFSWIINHKFVRLCWNKLSTEAQKWSSGWNMWLACGGMERWVIKCPLQKKKRRVVCHARRDCPKWA